MQITYAILFGGAGEGGVRGLIRTTARILAGAARRTLGVQSFHLLKNRINCDTGFARGIMEKYSLGDSELPPVSFVFLETGEDEREEEGRAVELLFQLLRYEDYGINIAFRNMVLGFLRQNMEFRLERLKYMFPRDYVRFLRIYERILKIIEAPAEREAAPGKGERGNAAGYDGEKSGAGKELPFEIDDEERRRQRELAERELAALEMEIRGEGALPSVEAARARRFLEGLPETEQEYLALVIGTSRKALLERLQTVNRREWRILEEEIMGSLRLSEQFFLERQMRGERREERQESLPGQEEEQEQVWDGGTGVQRWKYILRQWVGFMDPEEWETVAKAAGGRRTDGAGEMLSEVERIFGAGDKEQVMEFLGRADSMEEIYPLIDFIYRDGELKERFQGWLPGLDETVRRHMAFVQAESLGTTDSLEVRKQAVSRLAELLEEEEWLHIRGRVFGRGQQEDREDFIAQMERLSEEDREDFIAQMERLSEEDREDFITQMERLSEEDRSEILASAAAVMWANERENVTEEGDLPQRDGRDEGEAPEAGGSEPDAAGLGQWKSVLGTWLNVLEPREWEAVARAVDEQEHSDWGGKEFFRAGDRQKAVGFLMEAESVEEIYPLINFIYEDRGMREASGLLPAKLRSKEDGQGGETGRTESERRAVHCLEELLEREIGETAGQVRRESFSLSLEQWKTVFGQWLNILETEEWKAVVGAVDRRESLVLEEKAIVQEDKRRAAEVLEKARSMEEIYPLIDFIEKRVPQEGYRRETGRREAKDQAANRLAELLEHVRRDTGGRVEKEAFSLSLEQWKTVLGQWLNVLETEEWEAAVRAMDRRESFIPGEKAMVQAEDRERGREVLAKAKSLEELYPLIEFIYEDRDMRRRFGQFLPDGVHFRDEGHREMDRPEKEKQAVRCLVKLLENEKAQGTEIFRRESSAAGLGEWKEVLGRWLSVLEKEEWEAVVRTMEGQERLFAETEKLFWTEDKGKAIGTLSGAESLEEIYPLIDFIYRDGGLRQRFGGLLPGQLVSMEEAHRKDRDRRERERQAVRRLTEFLENERREVPGKYRREFSEEILEQWGEVFGKWQRVLETEKREDLAGFLGLNTWKNRLGQWIGSLKTEEWEALVRVVRRRENVLAARAKEILEADRQEAANLLAQVQSMEEIAPFLGLLHGDETGRETQAEGRSDLDGYSSLERDELELRRQAAGRLAGLLEGQREMGRQNATAGNKDEGAASSGRGETALRRQILSLSESQWRNVWRHTAPLLRKKFFLRQVEEGGYQEVEEALLVLREENRDYYGDARQRELPSQNKWPKDGAESVWRSLVERNAGWKNPERGRESFMEEVERLGEPEEITGLLELFYRKEPVRTMAEGWIPEPWQAEGWYRESKEEANAVTRQLKDSLKDWVGFLEENQWKAVENRILEESRKGRAAGLMGTWKNILAGRRGYAKTRGQWDDVVEYALAGNVRLNHRSFGEKGGFMSRDRQAYGNRERYGRRREMSLDGQRPDRRWPGGSARDGRELRRGMVLLTRSGGFGAVSGRRREPGDMPQGAPGYRSAGTFPAGKEVAGEDNGRGAGEFAYVPADMVMSRLRENGRKEQVKASAADIEKTVQKIKEETVKDIRFAARQRENDGESQNGLQVKELLKKFAAQQKELEELKKGQANLIRTMSAGHVTDMVMKQLRDQIRIEKMRRGL